MFSVSSPWQLLSPESRQPRVPDYLSAGYHRSEMRGAGTRCVPAPRSGGGVRYRVFFPVRACVAHAMHDPEKPGR